MTSALGLANLGLRFVLELGALGLLAYWGFHASPGGVSRVVLALAAPLAFAALWGLLASPRARVRLTPGWKQGVQVTLLLLPAAAVASAGRPVLATAFAGVVVGNALLLAWWPQQGR